MAGEGCPEDAPGSAWTSRAGTGPDQTRVRRGAVEHTVQARALRREMRPLRLTMSWGL